MAAWVGCCCATGGKHGSHRGHMALSPVHGPEYCRFICRGQDDPACKPSPARPCSLTDLVGGRQAHSGGSRTLLRPADFIFV